MTLTMLTFTRCAICGYRNTGLIVGTGTILKHGLRFKATIGVDTPEKCDECGHPQRAPFHPGWHRNTARLDAESQRLVDTARAKRGWAA